ncbi:MAG TPA: hypothetical protein VER14_06290 [Phototrophicaceae bacterium]|nr:hypothetical protein [Phototrophicaceae bacterium]
MFFKVGVLAIGNLIHLVCESSNKDVSFKVVGEGKLGSSVSIVTGLIITEKIEIIFIRCSI